MIVSDWGLEKFKESFKEKVFFGNEPTPELIGILTVYFVQGILGLARLAVSFFLKDELGLSPAQVAALVGVAALPWVVKPVFGFLSDGLPLFGYRRRPYLILSGLIGTVAWLSLATVVTTAWAAMGAILLSSLSVAISDVIVDSLVVERARQESLSNSGSLQSLTWGTSALGGLITAYLSGWLLEHFSTQTVFGITATFPLLVSVVAWLIAEEHTTAKPNTATIKFQIKQLRGAITQKAIWLPTAFIFLWQATPTADSAFFFFTTNELGFQPEFLGRVRLVTSIASLVGIWLFQRFLKSIPFRTIMGWTTLLSAVLGMSALLLVTHANRTLGIDDHWFSLGDSLILTVMGQIAFMPVLVLSARLCPPGVEASLFALLMSIWNLSGLLSHELGALLTHWLGVTEHNFDKLWLLVIITNLSSLLPLPFLHWLPADDPQKEFQGEGTSRPLPPVEIFEHHTPGTQTEQPFLPDLMPEFLRTPVGSKAVEEP
ncbi:MULTISPECIES: folate/biopterin family MFS transporter [unclassified Coleofasciculus]|uniref:folate/biopterin family MFS transporter n=1 Tax=unclassified Coleofasciculus TaxID=2692782 RepID=UPI001880152A|nr:MULTISPECIES: folate/biopterin family MFS transporter [unclassified Coleofasciculus]MBE9126327.1 folate/biopterin family MFS transporter [Coleofasciculus sp. LEGE 07081]MBE9147496.1 folate/biopterin family MFS transporter [Coleofasciculus sp. LEGE 07092]